ncbi:hypothetical protein K490DRAFT_7559, partial [Saccharata proteae CBS 121410]
HFYKKAALTILSARTTLTPAFNKSGGRRQSRWFNIVLDETDDYEDDMAEWTQADSVSIPPPPLCLEVYLDAKDLTNSQALVVMDEHGKRWNVMEALNPPAQTGTRPSSRYGMATQVVLERWVMEVGDRKEVSNMTPEAAGQRLPEVYKNGIALFRALYTFVKLLPAWKYYRRITKQSPGQPSLPLKYRISNGLFQSPRRDTLDIPLYPAAGPVTQNHVFDPVRSPVGTLNISATFRSNTDFRVDDSESLLSSHFMGMDDHYFSPSLPTQDSGHAPGSLPANKIYKPERPELGHAYGSMSTFHQVGPASGTSPISALRAARDIGTESPEETHPQKIPPNHRTATGSKPSLRTDAGPSYQRRTSVSFQPTNPFKAGSLASSPVPSSYIPPSPSSSLGRTPSTGPFGHTRNRSSQYALPQQALRTPASLPNETAIASSASSSPKPAPISRYSSSFGNRRSRFSVSGGSKTEDDNNSSGRGSASSSAQRLEGAGSSGSVPTDDDNINDFLKLLAEKKDLKSLNRTDSASRDASMRRTTAALSKYQRMRESNAALSDSINSSVVLHRSSSSSSRQLANVPGMVGGASVSTSSSPGKPISPHTPHTPAIPSRLSANSIIDYSEPRRSRSPRPGMRNDVEEQRGESGSDSTTREGTQAIAIPTSPRPWAYNARRSSSTAQPQRNTLEDEADLYGLRSASMPTDERPDLSLSELLNRHGPAPTTSVEAQRAEELNPEPSPRASDPISSRPASRDDIRAATGSSNEGSLPYRSRFPREVNRARGLSSGGSSTSLGGLTGRNRYSFSSRAAAPDDDEPLLFTMSELGANSRRSLEEGRNASAPGGSSSGRKRG